MTTFEDQKAIQTIFNNKWLQNKKSWIYILILNGKTFKYG